jgi:sugar O-acyltransferase (sialic acid O-acetyltransferase NeuD family)
MCDLKVPVIVVGAGGHAKVLMSALLLQKRNVLGFVDLDLTLSPLLGARHLGDDGAVLAHSPESVQLVNGIGSINSTRNHQDIYDRFRQKHYCFATVIHPSAVVATEVEIENGVQICGGAIVQAGCRLCANVIVNTGARVDHDCMIDAHAHVSPGVTICGGVHIGQGAHIGAGATIIQGIEIGEGSVVGAGALVIRNVPPATTVVGVPATPIGERGTARS